MRGFKKNKILGFTLIELLVVIAVIGILAAVGTVAYSKAQSQTRNSQRKANLKTLQQTLEMYYSNNNLYPSTGGNWYSSDEGDMGFYNSGNYIPGLVPTYIKTLPRDPLGGAGIPPTCGRWKKAFLYRSVNGTGYELLSHCAQEGTTWDSNDIFYDSVRPTWAWKVCEGQECSQ